MIQVLPVNLKSNLLALSNCVYLSSKKKKGESKTVHVKIKERYLKCRFLDELKEDTIGVSKNMREYLQIDTAHTIQVQILQSIDESKFYLKDMTIEISVRAKQAHVQVNYDEQSFIRQIKNKEDKTFFNVGQNFYVYLFDVTYLCLIKKINPEKKSTASNFGLHRKQTQINILIHPQEKLIKSGNEEKPQEKGLFKSGFKASEMGIGGLDEEISEIFRRAFVSRRFENSVVDRFGVKHVKGILLYGPPGTGKTLIARQLSKALDIDEKNYKKVDGPEIFNKYVGESENNIRKLFEKAKQDERTFGPKSPLHVVVFDEIDAVCKQRGMYENSSSTNDAVVNQLLSIIDGVDALNNILVVGMTNRKDLLDEAILRPGRFEVHIEVKLPTEKGREDIFNIHTAKLQKHNLLAKNCKIEELARITKNYTGAEIESVIKAAVSHTIIRSTNILNFSQKLKVDEKNLKLQLQDFLKAVDEIRPQFGVDEQKFSVHLKSLPFDYGQVFESINAQLDEKTYIQSDSHIQLKSVLLYGSIGVGKMTFALNFTKRKNFPYVKVISPFNMIGMKEMDKVEEINAIFENAYKTPKACIIINNIERLLNHTSSVSSLLQFSNPILQTLMVLIKKVPPNKNCKLLIIGTSSLEDQFSLGELQLTSTFESLIQVPKLSGKSIQNLLVEKFKVQEGSAKKISKYIGELTFQQLLDTAGLVDEEKRNDANEWVSTFRELIQGNQDVFT